MSREKEFIIFLVDDDTKHLLLLKEYLLKKVKANLNIKIFSSGENCLQKLDENPDLIILDYYLDGINEKAKNGLDILKLLKKQNPDLNVVMLSSQDKIEVAVDSYDYGAKDYIIKNESAFLRTQIAVENIIREYKREQIIKDYRTGLKMAGGLMVLLIIALIFLVASH